MINWKVRIRNKTFWATFIPAVLMLIKCILDICGVSTEWYGEMASDIVSAVLIILTCLGVIVDPTTHGISDSERAMTYNKPYK